MRKTVKTTRCKKCGIKTSCKNSICALCRAGITQMHDELKELLKEDKKCHTPKLKRSRLKGSSRKSLFR